MRLWTIHPEYLDTKGLVAAWREALLALHVLAGKCNGYRQHPQLIRFRSAPHPIDALATFLAGIAAEAERRGYNFDVGKIPRRRFVGQLDETKGQLMYEWSHLRKKLRHRSPQLYRQLRQIKTPKPHQLFCIVSGDVRDWERR